MRILTLLAISAMSLAASAPAVAQGAMAQGGMAKGSMSHMSAADARMMNSCKAMSHEAMMKNRNCARMMRMHPDMMKGDAMMRHDNMMKKN